MQIKDHVGIVTGGASGLGEATVRRLVAQGGKAVIADMNAQRGEALAKELGDAARFVRCDVGVDTDAVAVVQAAQEAFGRIDILEKMSVVEVPRAEADRLIEALDRAKIAQRFVMPRLAEDWRFKAQPGRGGAPSGGYNSGYQGRKDSKARKGTVKPRN